jgi:hypothetical protein
LPKKNWFLKFKPRCAEENEQFIEEREDFGKRVLGFSESSVMGDFELVNLMREWEEDGEQDERFIISMISCSFGRVLGWRRFWLMGEEWTA